MRALAVLPIVRHLAVLLLATAMLTPTALAQEPGALVAARGTIEDLYAALTDVMKRGPELGRDGRANVLVPVVERSYDMDFMAGKALGRHWKKLPEDARARWRAAFQALTVTTYAERFDKDAGQVLVVEDAEPARRDTVVVHTRIDRPDDEAVEINYRMREAEGSWRIIDIYLNGTVSELALRRSEYTTVIERDGFDHLVESLEAKNAGS